MQLRLLTLLALALALLSGCQEAVLNAPPTSTINLSANPRIIEQNGGTSTVRAVVRLGNGELVPDGVIVNFFTTLGTIDAQAKTVQGVATATLRANGLSGVATLSALSGAADVVNTEVVIGVVVEQAQVTFVPSTLPAGGGSALINVRLIDALASPLPGRVVRLSVDSEATLGSDGGPLVSDADGRVSDTITTAETTVVTATIDGQDVQGLGTLLVLGAETRQVVLVAEPPSLPTGGGQATVVAYVTGAGATPVAGVTVSFTSSSGTLTPASATTGGDGRARTVLSTDRSTAVVGRITGDSDTVVISVGGSAPGSLRLLLSASRTSVTVSATTGAMGCDPSNPNSQLPATIEVRVEDLAAQPQGNVAVTLSIESSTSLSEGRGGFCAATTDPTAWCDGMSMTCPAPPAQPTPDPTPTSMCAANALPKTATAVSGTDGIARFSFTFEDTDICECRFARRVCVATITASAADASALNQLEITMAR